MTNPQMEYIEVNSMIMDTGDETSRQPTNSPPINPSTPQETSSSPQIFGNLRARNLIPPTMTIASKTTIIEEILCTANPSNGENGLDISDFECPLCFRLFCKPISTPCGHTYCQNCLMAALRYSLMCPLCRCELDSPTKKKYCVNVTLLHLLEKHFGEQYQEREDEEKEEEIEEDATKETKKISVEMEDNFYSWSTCFIPSVRETCCVLLSCT